MTETLAHTFLNNLLGPDPAARATALRLAHRFAESRPDLLRELRPHLLARLEDDPADRLRPAMLVRELYRDNGPLLRVVVEALRSDAPDDDVRDAVLELTTVAVPKLILECAFDRPALFGVLFERSPRWVTRLLISEGRPGILTLRLFVAELPDPLLHQVAAVIADEAVTSPHDLTPLVRPLSAVRLRPNARFEVGVALWRLTWTVDPDFVAYLLESRAGWYQPQLLASVTLDLLVGMPKLDEMVSRLLEPNTSVARARTWIAPVVRRVLGLGTRGVKLLLAIDPHHNDGYLPFRAELLAAAAGSESLSRAFLPIALRTIESPSLHIPGKDVADAIRAACRVIATVGPAATEAVPKLLLLAEMTVDYFGEITAAVLAAVTAREALVEAALDSLRKWASHNEVREVGGVVYRRFGAYAALLAAVDPSTTAARLIRGSDLGLACRVSERIGDGCPSDVQRRWAEALIPYLADRENEHRETAARMLANPLLTPDVEAAMWPWLVAAVAVPLENRSLIDLFQYLTPVPELVAELTRLAADPNPVIAASAAAALSVLNSAT